MTKQSRHLKPKKKTSRSRLIASMEATARRLSRYAERAECDFDVEGTMRHRAFSAGAALVVAALLLASLGFLAALKGLLYWWGLS